VITFFLALALLIIGHFTYGVFVEKIIKPDQQRATPALTVNDGIDYVPLDWKKVFLVQLLNIAGLGPIFGAIAGALWGPIAFLWIVFGSIFAGGVHDYFTGMLSVRNCRKISRPGYEKSNGDLLGNFINLSWNCFYDRAGETARHSYS
jgi:carbon starvation protein CstA